MRRRPSDPLRNQPDRRSRMILPAIADARYLGSYEASPVSKRLPREYYQLFFSQALINCRSQCSMLYRRSRMFVELMHRQGDPSGDHG